MTTKWRKANFGSRAGKCRLFPIPFRSFCDEYPTKIAVWLDDRLHLTALYSSTAGHEVPKSAGSWFYVFGSATLLCFIIQVITGACLAFVYIPSTNEAWTSLQYLNHDQFWGWYLRAVHNWGSNFMVAIMTLHMIQVFLFGAYKYPRELTWVSGIFLLLMTWPWRLPAK